jgi:hypothetical protein
MDKPIKSGAQIYGYTVCLVAVITFLICITNLVEALMERQDPLHAGWSQPGTPSLASFENYKMDILKSVPSGDAAKGTSYVPDDATLRAMYQSAKDDKIRAELHRSGRTLVVSSLVLVISIALFITHWMWMKKVRTETVSTPSA